MLKGSFEKRISKPIVTLATIGISLGIAVMIVSMSVAVGFQTEVRDKVLGFGGHVQITKVFSNDAQETSKMEKSQYWIADLMQEESIKSIHQIAYKPGIIQSRNTIDTNNAGKDLRDMSGMIFKGIGQDYDYEFLAANLSDGKIPKFEVKGVRNDSILISKYTSNQLQVSVGEKVTCFFVSEDGPKQKNKVIGGIYETGLEDFDKKFAFIDIYEINNINGWGIETFVSIEENCTSGLLILKASTFGGNGNYKYQWNGSSYSEADRIPLCLESDTTIITLISTDFEYSSYLDEPSPSSIPDTATLTIVSKPNLTCSCASESENLLVNYVNDSVTEYISNDISISTLLQTSGGTYDNYCGGFEVIMKDFESLQEGKKTVQFYTDNLLHIQSITERNEDIFNWLGMLDLNVYIIIGLMILVAVINMTSALLVIILERTKMIGILKSLGTTNWSIRKIFLLNGGFIIIKGIIYGNIVAFSIIIIQNTTGFLTLSQSNYYVSVVPMHFLLWQTIAVNVGAYLICNLALILPSYIITRINPISAIKFE